MDGSPRWNLTPSVFRMIQSKDDRQQLLNMIVGASFVGYQQQELKISHVKQAI